MSEDQRIRDLEIETARLRVEHDRMHQDMQSILAELRTINSAIKPLAEWVNKSRGAVGVIGTLTVLVLSGIGTLIVSAIKSAWP